MRVSVLVPYRGDGGARDRVWHYVQGWWEGRYPEWELVVGSCPDGGPWVKGLAVADALARCSGEICVVADADVICDLVEPAVAAVARGAGWAVPHLRVYRLTELATIGVTMHGEDLPEPTPSGFAPVRRRPGQRRSRLAVDSRIAEAYAGTAGGGLVVLSRRTLLDVPMDPRFTDWGQEDQAWGRALAVMAGPPWRGQAPLWHLWHPPQRRLSRTVGSPQSMALYRRYLAAGTAEQMRALLGEVG